MDVNQASSIVSVHQDAKKSPQHRDPEDQGAGKDDQPGNESGSWRELEAAEVDANLIGGMTPEAQAIIDTLNHRIEPLRAELELAKGREAHFRELAARHSFLNIPCRREFIRELTHVLTHIDHLSAPPTMIALHIVGTEEVRMKAGRAALDHVLSDVANIFQNLLQPADILGNLGGNDFGIILLSESGDSAPAFAARLKEAVRAYVFTWAEQQFELDVLSGNRLLRAEISAEAALDAADQDLRKHLSIMR